MPRALRNMTKWNDIPELGKGLAAHWQRLPILYCPLPHWCRPIWYRSCLDIRVVIDAVFLVCTVQCPVSSLVFSWCCDSEMENIAPMGLIEYEDEYEYLAMNEWMKWMLTKLRSYYLILPRSSEIFSWNSTKSLLTQSASFEVSTVQVPCRKPGLVWSGLVWTGL